MQLNNIHICYCSQYNGCSLSSEINGKSEDLQFISEFADRAEQCTGRIVEDAYANYGEYIIGDNTELLRDKSIAVVKEVFGADVNVTFEIDSQST
jgi:hypothetical protein